MTECSPCSDDRILDLSMEHNVQIEGALENSNIIQPEYQDNSSDNTLESEEDMVEPPSPIMKRDMRIPAIWPRSDAALPRTPARGQCVIKSKLEPIFEISGVDLKGKLVQVLNFSETKDKKCQL